MAGQNQKAPPKQYPFPRDKTVKITGPAYEDTDTLEQAEAKWRAYVRVVTRLRQMDLPVQHKIKD